MTPRERSSTERRGSWARISSADTCAGASGGRAVSDRLRQGGDSDSVTAADRDQDTGAPVAGAAGKQAAIGPTCAASLRDETSRAGRPAQHVPCP